MARDDAKSMGKSIGKLIGKTSWRKCPGSLRLGVRGTFGMVACPVCRTRLKPMPGNRLPNHKRPPDRRNQDNT